MAPTARGSLLALADVRLAFSEVLSRLPSASEALLLLPPELHREVCINYCSHRGGILHRGVYCNHGDLYHTAFWKTSIGLIAARSKGDPSSPQDPNRPKNSAQLSAPTGPNSPQQKLEGLRGLLDRALASTL